MAGYEIFVGYLLFDALIGNTDRHHENWGIVLIRDDEGTRTIAGGASFKLCLAPSFDHASSLGRDLTDLKRQERLNTRYKRGNAEAYAERGRSAFYGAGQLGRTLTCREVVENLLRIFPNRPSFGLRMLPNCPPARQCWPVAITVSLCGTSNDAVATRYKGQSLPNAATEPHGVLKLFTGDCRRRRTGVNDPTGQIDGWHTAVLRGVFAFACVAAACWSASAADLTTTLSRENKTIVLLTGEIAAGDASRLRDIVKASITSGRPVSGIRFNSPSGSLIEGVRLAAIIQNAKIATVIASGATCASACFIAFIAGNQKYVSATATVGVPGAADKFGRDAAGEVPSIVRVAKELGLLDAIVEKMLATREDEIAWLTPDDLRAMGATTTGRPSAPIR